MPRCASHDLLEAHPWERTADWSYVRFHGPDARRNPYHGRYGPRRLRDASSRMERWLDAGHDVYAYFNNDYDGAAVADATWLAKQLGRDGASQATQSGRSHV